MNIENSLNELHERYENVIPEGIVPLRGTGTITYQINAQAPVTVTQKEMGFETYYVDANAINFSRRPFVWILIVIPKGKEVSAFQLNIHKPGHGLKFDSTNSGIQALPGAQSPYYSNNGGHWTGGWSGMGNLKPGKSASVSMHFKALQINKAFQGTMHASNLQWTGGKPAARPMSIKFSSFDLKVT